MTSDPRPELKDCCVPVREYRSNGFAKTRQDARDLRRELLRQVSVRRGISNRLRDNPDMLRRYQPPPPVPQSVALLTALGYLQDMRWREPIDDLDELANAADIHLWEIHALVLKAEEKDYLTYTDEGVALTPKGWKWYEKHSPS